MLWISLWFNSIIWPRSNCSVSWVWTWIFESIIWSWRWTFWTDFGQKRAIWRLEVWRQQTSRIQLQIVFFPHFFLALPRKFYLFLHNCKIGFHKSSHMNDWMMSNRDGVKRRQIPRKVRRTLCEKLWVGTLHQRAVSENAKTTCRMRISKCPIYMVTQRTPDRSNKLVQCSSWTIAGENQWQWLRPVSDFDLETLFLETIPCRLFPH